MRISKETYGQFEDSLEFARAQGILWKDKGQENSKEYWEGIATEYKTVLDAIDADNRKE